MKSGGSKEARERATEVRKELRLRGKEKKERREEKRVLIFAAPTKLLSFSYQNLWHIIKLQIDEENYCSFFFLLLIF